jgi:hypothetical protein
VGVEALCSPMTREDTKGHQLMLSFCPYRAVVRQRGQGQCLSFHLPGEGRLRGSALGTLGTGGAAGWGGCGGKEPVCFQWCLVPAVFVCLFELSQHREVGFHIKNGEW